MERDRADGVARLDVVGLVKAVGAEARGPGRAGVQRQRDGSCVEIVGGRDLLVREDGQRACGQAGHDKGADDDEPCQAATAMDGAGADVSSHVVGLLKFEMIALALERVIGVSARPGRRRADGGGGRAVHVNQTHLPVVVARGAVVARRGVAADGLRAWAAEGHGRSS